MKSVRLPIGLLALGGMLLSGTMPALAQVSDAPALEQRIAAIEQQLRILQSRVDSLQGGPAAAAQVAGGEAVPVGEQLEMLDQKIRVIERKRELEAETATALAKTTAGVTATRDGFSIKSPDNAFVFNLRGNLQADTRIFPNGAPAPGASTLTITKVRPTFDGTLYKNFSFKIMPDFGSGATSLLDAYIDTTYRPWLKLRAGKFKGPVGLERLVADAEVEFYERSLPTNLVPNRDVGAQLFGDLFGGVVSYAGGIFNGVADGGSTDLDTDNHREFAGRVFLLPFRKSTWTALQAFGIGAGSTSGPQTGTPANPVVAAYRTTSQQIFFRYRADNTVAGTTFANGTHTRISPQANFYLGPFGAWAEYVISSQDVRRGSTTTTLDNSSWQVAATYVLTGEKASYRSVAPLHPFDAKQRAWGALELVARYAQLSVDKSAFPIFADPLTAASGARSWTVGGNWYVNRNVKIVLNYEQTDFQTVEGGVKRKQERALLERFQLAF